MRKWFCLLLLGYSLTAQAQCSRELITAWSDYPPFASQSATGNWQGQDISRLNRIFQKAGCNYRIIRYPIKRAFKALKEGDIDFLAGTSITNARKRYATFSLPYRHEVIKLVARADDDILGYNRFNIRQLLRQPLRIVYGASAYYGSLFEQVIRKTARPRFIASDDPPRSRLRLVAEGLADLVVIEELSAQYLIRQMGLEHRLVLLPHVLHQSPVHLMFSKQSMIAADIARINQAIHALKFDKNTPLIEPVSQPPEKAEMQQGKQQ